ncbi:hypothetical protein MSG81_19185 [Acinetobacter baumannii]|nr:hypothetical protein [Acinetobacter baumannii]
MLQHPVAAVASCARYDYCAESRHDYPAIVQYRQTGQTVQANPDSSPYSAHLCWKAALFSTYQHYSHGEP